jgi:hypothetical protein
MTSTKKNIDYKKILKSLSKNYWAISTLILATLFTASLLSGGIGGGTASLDEAGQNVLEFAIGQGASAELIKVEDGESLYTVTLSIDGQEVPVFVTKDGKTLVPQPVPLTRTETPSTPSRPTEPASTDVPKSNKPIVELFVMSHCPYGTQIEKGILPVIEVLKDKIDFELKFVYYAMHPTQGEVEEQLNQYCIQKEQNDKFTNYLTCFLEAGDGAGCLDTIGIDKTKLATCTTATDAEFDVIANLEDKSSWMSGKFPQFNIHKADNDKYQVGGSPTLIINGAKSEAGRDSISLLNAICGAFNTTPEECNTEFDAGSPTPGFGFSTSTTANNAAAGCGV